MAENDSFNKKLTGRQKKAIAALLSENTIKAAAEKAHIGERTIYRWLGDTIFRSAVSEAEARVIDEAARRLISLQKSAIDQLENILNDETCNASLKLRTSQIILDYLLKIRELQNYEVRLLELEKTIYGE